MVGARRLTSRRLRSPRERGRRQAAEESGEGADDPGVVPPPGAGAEDHANRMAPELFDGFHKIVAQILTVRISARPSRDNADGGRLPKIMDGGERPEKGRVFQPALFC